MSARLPTAMPHPQLSTSPCCGADVVQLADRTEFWLVTKIDLQGRPLSTEEVGHTDLDFRDEYRCGSCELELAWDLNARRFVRRE